MCEHCVFAKGHKVKNAHKDPARRPATRPGYRIHVDIKVLNNFRSVSGFGYVAIFIDEYSGKTWSVNLKRKSDFAPAIKRLFGQMRAELGRGCDVVEKGFELYSMRSDNAGENISVQIDDYVRENNMTSEFSVAHVHEQNGLAESGVKAVWSGSEAIRIGGRLPPNR